MTASTPLGGPVPTLDAADNRSFPLPALSYGYADLAPLISETALRTHHLKHARYVETVNRILEAEGRPIHLWDHAYSLDYRQDRAAWLASWWDSLANWHHADRQYAAALGQTKVWRYPSAT